FHLAQEHRRGSDALTVSEKVRDLAARKRTWSRRRMATRMVAGGPSVSERPPVIEYDLNSTPAGSRRSDGARSPSARAPYATQRGSYPDGDRETGGRSLRSDHRLPYETPPASNISPHCVPPSHPLTSRVRAERLHIQ